MTKISSYAAVTPTGTDLLIGTDTSASDATKNFTIDSIGQYLGSSQVLTQYANYFDFSSGATTSFASSNTFYPLVCTTTEGFSSSNMTVENNKVTYTGAQSLVLKIEGIAAVSGGNNDEIHFAFYKNGSLVPCSEQDVVLSSAGKGSSCAFQCMQQFSTNDYVQVYVKNVGDTTSITLDNVNVIVSQV